jgi:hypothetical protein
MQEYVRFGAFELNVRTGELSSLELLNDGAKAEKILLREQIFQILRMLIDREGGSSRARRCGKSSGPTIRLWISIAASAWLWDCCAARWATPLVARGTSRHCAGEDTGYSSLRSGRGMEPRLRALRMWSRRRRRRLLRPIKLSA